MTNPNDSVIRVNGSGQKVGPNILLKVMSGDKVDIAVQYYFNNLGTPAAPVNSFTDVLNSLANGIYNMTAGTKGVVTDFTNPAGPVYTGLNSFLTANDPTPGTKPKAYLNWILLDEQMKYVNSYPQSGAAAVATAGTNGGVLQAPLGYTGIPITKNGYLYIWVSNETPSWDVFFDNLSVKHYQGPLLEETHYYPFGLEIAGLSTKALKSNYNENRYKFNGGNELQSKEFSDGSGLELYDAVHRIYDPQIGRFVQIDPLADVTGHVSPYSFGQDNPISHLDPLGLTDTVVTTKTTNLASVTVWGHKPRKWGGFNWPESSKYEREQWARNQGVFVERSFRNQSLSQKGDPASYTSSLPMYKRWSVEEKNYRAMQAWAVGIVAAPALIATSPAELALALRMKVAVNVTAFAVDASIQSLVNAMEHKNIFSNYNVISGGASLLIGVPEGVGLSNIVGVNLVNSTLSTSVNVSWNSIFNKDPMLSFNPLSIIINTAFGSAAGKYSQFVGEGTGSDAFGEAVASPINLAGAALDESTKSKQ